MVDEETESSQCKQISMQLILYSNPQNKETINYIEHRLQNIFRRAFSAESTSIVRSRSKSRAQELSVEIVAKDIMLVSRPSW